MTTDLEFKDGWRQVRFGDVVREVKIATKDPAADGLTRVVGLEHLDPESLPLRRWNELADLGDGTSFTRVFRAGQVLFGKRRAYQRKVAVADFDGICSSDLLVFEPSTDELLREFLPYLVQSDGFFDHALGTSAGSLSPRTKFQELAKYEFELPPVAEQHRIVELLSGASEVVERYRCVRAAARSSWLAIARRQFGSALTRPLEEVAEVDLGKKRDPKLLREGSPVRYMRAANVKDSTFELDNILEMNFTESEVERFQLLKGDVLVTEGCGSLDQIGACAVWNDELPAPTAFQMTLLRLRARDHADSRLLQHWAHFAFRTGRFASVASGTSVFHLSAARVREMPFPVLDDGHRREVVEGLDLAAETERLAVCAVARASEMAVSARETLLAGGGL